MAERKRIEQENQRKLDEYEALVKKGQENVKDLNLRFGDWYFVVDDDVFRKIRLSRDKVVKKKETPKADGRGRCRAQSRAACRAREFPVCRRFPARTSRRSTYSLSVFGPLQRRDGRREFAAS